MFDDKNNLIRFIVLLLIVGFWIVRILYQSFVKPLARREAGDPIGRNRPRPPAEEGGLLGEEDDREAADDRDATRSREAAGDRAPARDIRSFLEEIRMAGNIPLPVPAAGSPESSTPPSGPTGSPFSGTFVQQAPAAENPVHEGPRKRRGGSARRDRGAPRGAPPSPLPAGSGHGESIHEYLDSLAERGRAPGPVSGGRIVPVIPGLGASLKDAMLAQVILGPPRCRQRRYRRG